MQAERATAKLMASLILSLVVRYLAIPIETRDTEFHDADELERLVGLQCVLDPVAEPHQTSPARFAAGSQRPGRLSGMIWNSRCLHQVDQSAFDATSLSLCEEADIDKAIRRSIIASARGYRLAVTMRYTT